ncbi:muconate/chloromuconate family cycloisomerase [Acidovorax sp. D2M1]|uniref:Muconate/chloromuconate family cycloisomerase n=1 Tax=Acidovorax benzenivorans TaxID=2987520 RepID=A0ABT5S002_9BURK|nr:muconate/chloromuconate family cycloisomerase [Acidovorax benzenivorans]MDD2179279.1 muconate/chloromuconate family cycloisomerase [Acidovorax benzenivorans]
MKIESIQAIIVDLPIARPHKLAMATLNRHSLLVVRMETDLGIEGLGELSVIPHYSEESITAAKAVIDDVLAPGLIGQDPRRIENALLKMDRLIKGNYYSKAALEMACVDITAKALGVPASALFGGRTQERLQMLWVLANGQVDLDVAEALQKLNQRTHRLFLVKVGSGDVRENVARAIAVKAALGEDAAVRVDANQAWDEATAGWAIGELQAGGIEVVEQPVHRANVAAMQRLTATYTLPIMADEAVVTIEDALAFSSSHACDALSLKVSKHGGMTRTKEVSHIASAAGITLFGGTMLEGRIGTSACAQLFSTLPSLPWGCQLFGPQLLSDDVARVDLRYEDYALVPPSDPGLGAELDLEKLAFYRRSA